MLVCPSAEGSDNPKVSTNRHSRAGNKQETTPETNFTEYQRAQRTETAFQPGLPHEDETLEVVGTFLLHSFPYSNCANKLVASIALFLNFFRFQNPPGHSDG